jgi:uncharacterized protein YqjF (DUF2071 family)
MSRASAILDVVAHRPWPLPGMPWALFQSWRELLFAHWPLAPEVLRPLVPAPLELDLYEGEAWLGIVPFRIAGFRPHFGPPVPGFSEFPELNARTYVRVGGQACIYFFSLDAGSAAAVVGARALFRLPYHHAEMSLSSGDATVRFHSRRRSGTAAFIASYGPAGPVFQARPATLEHFLTERYALATVLRNGRVLRAEIHHRPWPLQPAVADIEVETVSAAADIALPEATPLLLHYAERQDTVIWLPTVVE